jgi:hypothetical protein
MELRVNLADREDVAAAHSLLALVLEQTSPVQTGVSAVPPAPAAPAVPATAVAAPLPTAPVVPLPPSGEAPQIPAPPAPAASPVSVAPVPSAPVTPPNPANVEVDASGLPWDERIHSSSKGKIADGTWKKKRGINDPALVARVEAELRQRMAPGFITVAASSVPPEEAAAVLAAAVFAPAVPFVPPAAPSVPAPPVAPSAPVGPATFEALMQMVVPIMGAGKLPPQALQEAALACGLPGLTALQQLPAQIPAVWDKLRELHPEAF